MDGRVLAWLSLGSILSNLLLLLCSVLLRLLRKADRPAMEAWYMDDSDEDQWLPHHLDPPQYVSGEALAKLGVLHWILNAVIYEDDPELENIRADRGYSYKASSSKTCIWPK